MFKKYLFHILLAAIFFTAGWAGRGSIQKVYAYSGLLNEGELQDVFQAIYSLIKYDYVDKQPGESMISGAIAGLVKSLDDPFSRYLNPGQMREFAIDAQGNFGGVGIELSINKSKLMILNIFPHSPASKAGIKPGGQILEINGKLTKKMETKEIFNELKGTVGDSISIKIKTKDGQKKSYQLKREIIKLDVIHADTLKYKSKKIGYIKIDKFSGNVANDTKKVIAKLKDQGATSLVIDLRDNPGGLLEEAADVSDLFLAKNKTIVTTKGRNSELDKKYVSKSNYYVDKDVKVCILINENSASAAEIVAGALQDLKRAKLIGVKSFGKGSVQRIFSLPHSSGLALTIQKYFTPNGKSIHKLGITPDLKVNQDHSKPEEEKGIQKIFKKNLFKKINDDAKFENSTKYQWRKILKENKINISNITADYFLYKYITRFSKNIIPNLDFDRQLVVALESVYK